ncbi:MAG: sigma-70 family RNA polymerase sigma factor [Nitritalea sp.]
MYTTQEIWENYREGLYFFILKRIKNEQAASDIFQNTFIKIHQGLEQLQDPTKVRAWVYQIARNEVHRYREKELHYVAEEEQEVAAEQAPEGIQRVCCFDKFVGQLPEPYRLVIEGLYLRGEKQQQVAERLGISLANVKARALRAKGLLKQQFTSCCQYTVDPQGKLVGEPKCCED